LTSRHRAHPDAIGNAFFVAFRRKAVAGLVHATEDPVQDAVSASAERNRLPHYRHSPITAREAERKQWPARETGRIGIKGHQSAVAERRY
jgi:hypothetical protein